MITASILNKYTDINTRIIIIGTFTGKMKLSLSVKIYF